MSANRIFSACLLCLAMVLPFAAQTSAVQNTAVQTAATQTTAAGSTTVQVPRLIRLNGIFTPSSPANRSTTINVTFSLYTEESGGTPLWQESQNVELDAGGHYSVLLGSTQSEGLPVQLFISAQAQWLGLQSAGEAEQPRIMLVSVPFALKAGDAETLGGKPASAYLTAPTVNSNATTSTSIATRTTAAGEVGSVRHSSATKPPVGGGGNANYIPLWTDSADLGSSLLYQSGNSVAMGTTTPTATFDVHSTSTVAPGKVEAVLQGDSISESGAVYAVQGVVLSPEGAGIVGKNGAEGGQAIGVGGSTMSPTGIAVSGVSVASTGTGIGIQGETNSPAGAGMAGLFVPTTGTGYGVYGKAFSPDAIPVLGLNTDASGTSAPVGVEGQSSSPTGSGVYGTVISTTGPNSGVLGTTVSTSGQGVLGLASATSGSATGVAGRTSSPSGFGGYFQNVATTGSGYGVEGTTSAPNGSGVYGVVNIADATGVIGYNSATSGATSAGVYGSTASSSGFGVEGLNSDTSGTGTGGSGVKGVTTSPNGAAVFGDNESTTGGDGALGVYGYSGAGSGVYGQSTYSAGVFGYTTASNEDGVAAIEGSSGGYSNGIYADTYSANGVGAFIDNAAGGYILVGTVNNNGAHEFDVDGYGDGYFSGDLDVGGELSKASGTFKIDHPLDPANKYLYHSFVESPDMMNIYNGNITTDTDGLATVPLPEWFEALNRDFRYQLTVMGQFAQAIVAQEVANHQFRIKTDKPNVKVSWQVTGVRQDAYANAHRVQVEVEKAPQDRGHYLHPELFGAPTEARIIRHSPPHKPVPVHAVPVKSVRTPPQSNPSEPMQPAVAQNLPKPAEVPSALLRPVTTLHKQ
jgi:hypothetical protein